MAYVGLSRTTSLQGLHIIDFEEDKIYSDPEITTSLENMQKAEFENAMPLLHCLSNSSSSLTLIHHNTEGLSAHVDDVKKHHEMCFADILCFTETAPLSQKISSWKIIIYLSATGMSHIHLILIYQTGMVAELLCL